MTIDDATWKRVMLEQPRARASSSDNDSRPTSNGWSQRGDRDPAAEATERQWIVAAQADPQAFAPLYERYVDLVYRYCLRRLADPERAADATSTIFIRAITALPRYQPRTRPDGNTFRSWLMTIARNVVIDESRRRRPGYSLTALEVADRSPSPEDRAMAADARSRIETALRKLPERQRQIVELRQVGLRGAEIAEVMGMSASAVKTAHFRAYARLRDLLTESDENDNQDGGQ